MLFKYNNTHVWGQQLTSENKLRLYMHVARKEGAAMAKREGNKGISGSSWRPVCQFLRSVAWSARRGSKEAEKKAAEKMAEIARLQDPELCVVTFSGLTKLQSEGLKGQGAAQVTFHGR